MTDNVTDLPISRVPAPLGVGAWMDAVELAIFRAITETLDFDKTTSLHHACGLAEARYRFLWCNEPDPQPWAFYIAEVTTVIRKLSVRQREKLRHPALDRIGAQRILDGE